MKTAFLSLVILTSGLLIGYHLHPKLTLFCSHGMVTDFIEVDGPLGPGAEGFVEYKKLEDPGFFHDWDEKITQSNRSDCSAFLYE